MKKLKLSSKAKTLHDLKKIINGAKVLPLVRFYAKDYLRNKDNIIEKILNNFNSNIIVRSSSNDEDSKTVSNAGSFDSILDVKCEKDTLCKAIVKVISSYGKTCEKDEVFIQPMLKNVKSAGVVFTADINTLAPYYIINYDESGNTSSVTSGDSNDIKTTIIFKNSKVIPDEFKKLLKAVKECKEIFDNNFLDIEFAFSENELYILQVRAIVRKNKVDLSDIDLEKSLQKLHSKIQKLNRPHPKLLGEKTIFGVMPDWNPAEMIGIKPQRLALSLYKELITDEIWAYQRDNYGYRNLRSFPLLVSFLGVPYIDTRVSFNSFIPKKLHKGIASKLVDFYLDELSKNKNYHDKVEFEIVYSCYYFGISKKLIKLKEKNFSNNEIKRIEFELLELTNSVIDVKNGLYKKDLEKVEILKDKFNEIVNSNLSIIDKIYWLIEDCKRYGTLPFAGIARAAFIAIQFLNSFVDEGVLSNQEKNSFLNSINTISKQLSIDKSKMEKKEFLAKYGHLRPGTYDINSLRYDENFDKYFSRNSNNIETKIFKFSKKQKTAIEKLIIEHGLQTNFNNLIRFIKEAIEGREYAKFIFTKHLSKVLQLIEEFGANFGISRDKMAYIDIQEIKNLYATLEHKDIVDILRANIEKNKNSYKFTQAVKLPFLIVNENDIYSFSLEKEEPNFITLKNITSEVVDIKNTDTVSLEGKIVCIRSADPGYDYLFSKKIAGLVTCYGGANSHMAIRCAELGIVAVIGCGENLYEKLKKAKKIFINSANKQIKILS
jgi:phosphohistidine swiveling domain-containing protein